MFPFSDADTRHSSFPVVNVALISLNLLVLFWEIAVGGLGFMLGRDSIGVAVFFHKWGFIPAELTRSDPFTFVRTGLGVVDIASPIPTWATIFSSLFIHGGLLHFFGNMAFLWVFGDNVEDHLGHLKYLAFYLLAGVVATLSHWVVDPGSTVPLVGASGAVSGVLGGYLLLHPYNRIKVLLFFFIIMVVQLPAMVMLGIWFGLQVVNALGTLGMSTQVNVAFFAHVGGFIAGVALMAVYKSVTGQRIWPSRFSYGSGVKYWRGRPLD